MDFREKLARIQERVGTACSRAERDPDEVTIVAVSKTHPPEAVDRLAEEGQLLFGENKIQEARLKIPCCTGRARWHMIGHLQTNKCRVTVELFEMVETVDSVRVALELDKWAERLGRQLSVLVQANVSGEASKFGYTPEALLADLETLLGLRHLSVEGLMTMAPWTPDPEKARPIFRRLRELKTRCEERGGVGLPRLSMGMSGDFEVAIEEGATLVRIGTALFGERSRRTELR